MKQTTLLKWGSFERALTSTTSAEALASWHSMNHSLPVCSLLAYLALFAPAASAAIILSGSPTTGMTFQITSPIVFTLTENVGERGSVYVVLQNWVNTSDGSATQVAVNPTISLSSSTGAFTSDLIINDNDIDSDPVGVRDGVLLFLEVPLDLPSGSQFTILSGNYTTEADPAFNAQALKTFTGTAYLTDGNFVRISNDVTVIPESSTMMLAALGVLGMIHRRR